VDTIAFKDVSAIFAELGWKTPVFSGGAAPVSPNASIGVGARRMMRGVTSTSRLERRMVS
jgi:hypothetical protein